jgi:uncharacterized protein (TIGR03086 family)
MAAMSFATADRLHLATLPATEVDPVSFVDLQPAAQRMSDLVQGIPDDALGAPTPCTDYTIAGLLDHIDRFALGFTAAATKSESAQAESPAGDEARLGDDWRTRIPQHLAALAPAWRTPDALDGMTQAGGIPMPAAVAVVVALEELVVHGWDLARASGQPYGSSGDELEVVRGFISQFAGEGQEDLRGDAYKAPVKVPDSDSTLEHVVALSGRDPHWSA